MNKETGTVLRRTPSEVGYSNCNAHVDKHESGMGVREMSREVLVVLRKCPKLRMFLSECRSFLWRIRTVLTNNDTHRVPIGSAHLEVRPERLCPNTHSHACIRDIERISSSRPWSTPMDWAAYRDSWEAGVQWAVSNLDSSSDSERRALTVSTRSSLKQV